jgi:FMN phosphatase YigB (HAD superfamily)
VIKATIIDLDNCVFDTRSMGRNVIAPVLASMAEGIDFIPEETLNQIRIDLWSFSLEDIIAKHNIPDSIAKRARLAYRNLKAPPWSKCYDDVNLLKNIRIRKILVTSGYSKFQWSKIEVTGIKGLFDEIIIESVDNPLIRKGKLRIFKELLEQNSWPCREVMVVGDSAFSELKAGKELGTITVQTLRPDVRKVDGFNHYVCDFNELVELTMK